jgi:Ca-activated chloride channel family protein
MFARFPATSRVGLMAYGHRQAGQCSDIQMLFPPGPVNAAAVNSTIDRLTARGKTPLTDAVRQAAAALRNKEQGGTIILVTDGIETCGGAVSVRANEPQGLVFEMELPRA